MEYTEFSFQNFKGIKEMTLPLIGGVTTLIGLNESGKTTILEAIFCFSYGAENLDVINPSMASIRVPQSWVPIAERANFNGDITISAVVRLSDKDISDFRKFMYTSHGLNASPVQKTIKITEQYLFENSRYSSTSRFWEFSLRGTKGQQRNARSYGGQSPEWKAAVEYLKQRLPRIYYFPNFLFELPERFALEEPNEKVPTEESDRSKFYRLTFEQILDELGVSANLDTHVVARLKSDDKADQMSLKSILLGMSRMVTQSITDGWSRIFGRAPTAQEVELEADVGDDGQAYLELKIKGHDGYYDLSERSLGFRWFFMFLLMTSYRGDPGGEKDVVFLLDEPASNLHSTAQAALLKSFEKLAERCHLVYTTHSHHLINIKWLDSAYVVKNDALGDDFEDYLTSRTAASTSISATPYRRFVSENPGKTSYFQPVLDLLEYRPSDLEPVPNVVLVEGKSDFFLLRYATEILGLKPQVKLVPGGGAGALDPLIRLHIGWGKSFIILLDADAEGLKQRKRYETSFGPLVAGRIVLIADACNDASVKEAEMLLDNVDKQKLIDSVFDGPSARPAEKKALAQAMAELYARREVVQLTSPSLERIAALLVDMETRLEQQKMT